MTDKYDGFRACDQCGCCTNAKLRRCCDAGYLADKAARDDRTAPEPCADRKGGPDGSG